MASKYDIYDNAFLGILQNEGKIDTFLDAVFSFLRRRYDTVLFCRLLPVVLPVHTLFLQPVKPRWPCICICMYTVRVGVRVSIRVSIRVRVWVRGCKKITR